MWNVSLIISFCCGIFHLMVFGFLNVMSVPGTAFFSHHVTCDVAKRHD